MGIHTFDASVGGLGGCPYAKGATGNVATEDIVFMLNGLGIETGIDIDKLVDAGAYISNVLGRAPISRVGRALLASGRGERGRDRAALRQAQGERLGSLAAGTPMPFGLRSRRAGATLDLQS
jgi:hypothetical protein